MFKSKWSSSNVLITIAEGLFSELQSFGQLGIGTDISSESFYAYLSSHASFLGSFLEFLEQICDLEFQEKIPYCYSIAKWPENVPIAGYTQTQLQPLPSQVARSYIYNWNSEIINKSIFDRLMRASVFLCVKHGFEYTINYLFDLLKQGFIINVYDISQVIVTLCAARSQTNSDTEMVQQLLGNHIPFDTNEWIESKVTIDWINNNPSPNEEVKNIFESIISQTIEELDKVRNADSFDEWVLGQSVISGILLNTIEITDHFIKTPSIGLHSVLSQYEEIVCDIFGSKKVHKVYGHPCSSLKYRRNAFIVSKEIHSKFGKECEDRFFQERLLVPAKMKSIWLDLQIEKMPDGWNHLSWRLIHPISILYPSELPYMFTSIDKDSFNKDHNVMTELNEIVENSAYISSKNGNNDKINNLEGLVKKYPWNYYVYHELAIALDESGDSENSLKYIIPAIILEPNDTNLWKSLGIILKNLGRLEEALVVYSMYSAFFPKTRPNM